MCSDPTKWHLLAQFLCANYFWECGLKTQYENGLVEIDYLEGRREVHTSLSLFLFWVDWGSLLCGICLCSRTRLVLLKLLMGIGGRVPPLFLVIRFGMGQGVGSLLAPQGPWDTIIDPLELLKNCLLRVAESLLEGMTEAGLSSWDLMRVVN